MEHTGIDEGSTKCDEFVVLDGDIGDSISELYAFLWSLSDLTSIEILEAHLHGLVLHMYS